MSARASGECRQCRRTRPECGSSSRNRCLARAATCRLRPATAEPPEEPAGLSARFHGLRVAPKQRLIVLAPAGEFRRVGLGKHDRAGRLQPAHDLGVLGRDVVLEQRRAESGADTGGRRHVLDCRPAIRAGRQAPRRYAAVDFRRPRGIPRLIGDKRHDGIELRIEALDVPKEARQAPRPG